MLPPPLVNHVRPYAVVLLLAGVLMLLQSVASLATPWLAGKFAQALMEPALSAGSATGRVLGLWLGLFVAQAVLRFYAIFLLTRSGARVLAQLSNSLYQHLQSLPIGYFEQRKRGDLLSLLSNDVAVLSHFFTSTLAGVLPMVLVLAGSYL
ncbi:MAG: ABC transporter transmembrane domain-containing protein, partial [Parahaliea sp.]